MLDRLVSFTYVDIRMKDALDDISSAYYINFTYSADFIPVDERVSAHVVDVPLGNALDILFENTPIIYRVIGSQIALRLDPNKPMPQLTKNEPLKRKKSDIPRALAEESSEVIKEELPIVVQPDSTAALTAANAKEQPAEPQPDIQDDVTSQTEDEVLFDPEAFMRDVRKRNNLGEDRRYAQVSVLPNMGTNQLRGAEITNNVSLNLLWGENGGVQGVEVGTFVNKVTNDVEGFQFAGLGNHVGNDVTGMQIGGLYNTNKGKTTGIQMASLFNVSESADAGQFAGLVNVVHDDFKGMQASALYNKAGAASNAVQASGLINVTEGTAKVQIGGLFNKANRVEGGQLGGFMNVAKDVRGFQLAFINVSDTVSGVPIGLINIVKKGGYNRFEVSGGEILYFNLQLKLGAPKFYNIFHVGTRVPELGNYVWGLGYGVGFRDRKSDKFSTNLEAMAIQINENEPWTNQLNMIGRLRFLNSWRLGKARTEFFIGPTINIMISQLRQSETGEFGSSIMPYALFDTTNARRTNFKGWIGLNGGFRF